jgi:hypothetical protein
MKRFTPETARQASKRSRATRLRQAREYWTAILPVILEPRACGLTQRQIARELDLRGIRTRMGRGSWYQADVGRAMRQAALREGIAAPSAN